MKLTDISGGVLLTECKNFDPFVSCECGQCFRFDRDGDSMRLTACGREFSFCREGDGWLFSGVDSGFFREKLVGYFDLERDYAAIAKGFFEHKAIERAYHSGEGIRIFRQDPWEALISFIISQNNNIPRIKKIIDSLCRLLGENNDGTYSFPTARAIADAGVEGLSPIRSGFRAKYIVDAAEKVLSGEVDLERVASEDYETALAELKRIKGVGDKVANCVLLYGFGHLEAFPVDVWVKRILEKYFDPDFDPSTLGEYAGIAQQWLFNYERNEKDI